MLANTSSGIVISHGSDCDDDSDDSVFSNASLNIRVSESSEEEKSFGSELQSTDDTDEEELETEVQCPSTHTPACLSPPLTDTQDIEDTDGEELEAAIVGLSPCTPHCPPPPLTHTADGEEQEPEVQAPSPHTPDCPPPPLTDISSQADQTCKRTPRSKPMPLTLTPQASAVSEPGPTSPSREELESMWEEYAANRRGPPQYFLFPPFTAEEEEWIVRVNHPFKDYVYQSWQNNLHSSMQGWLEALVD